MNQTKDLSGWLRKSIYLEKVDDESVSKNLIEIIKKFGFKIKKTNRLKDRVSIEAIYGYRILASIINLIPLIGRHLPWGKRLGMQISIFWGEPIRVDINITPYMELFNTSEAIILSQTIGEKATDEYFAAYKIHSIIKKLYFKLGLSVPEKLSKFDQKGFFSDTCLTFLIYPFDGYKTSKKIFRPSKKGPKWSWGAFIVPEFWYIWHEIWGVSILFITVESYGSYRLMNLGLPFSTLVVSFLLIRIFSGRIGNIIYYYRYGRWHNDRYNFTNEQLVDRTTNNELGIKDKADSGDEQKSTNTSTKKAEEWLKKAPSPIKSIWKM